MHRTVLILITLLISFIGESHACRPRIWTAEDMVTKGNVIVLAEIKNKENGTITLRTISILKGVAPREFFTKASQIYGSVDGCARLEDRTWTRTHKIKEKWILVGSIKQGAEFIADTPAQKYEDSNPALIRLLDQIQQHVKTLKSKKQ